MTLQVALVGTDGIVLASDRRFTIHTAGKTTTAHRGRKIRVAKDRGLAISYARSHLGVVTGHAILREITDVELDSPESPLENLANNVFRQHSSPFAAPPAAGEVLVVLLRDLATVHHLDIYAASVCQDSDDVAFAGDNLNSALFFAQQYYSKLPVNDLAFLAAHTILMGAKINPSGIGGLDILLCRSNGFTFASEERVAEYVKRSEQLDKKIKHAIAPRQPKRGPSAPPPLRG